MIFYSDGGLGVNALGLFMLTHYRVLNGRNIRSTYDEETETIINMGHEKNSHMDVKKVDLKSLGIWFNDQPSKNVPSLRNLNLEDSELKAKNYKWKFAHSKVFKLGLSLKKNNKDTASGNSFLQPLIIYSLCWLWKLMRKRSFLEDI
jgi:hypothetical protein